MGDGDAVVTLYSVFGAPPYTPVIGLEDAVYTLTEHAVVYSQVAVCELAHVLCIAAMNEGEHTDGDEAEFINEQAKSIDSFHCSNI